MHPNLMGKGGAEVNCMLLLEHLQKTSSITLVTDNKLDLNKLNNSFGTNVKPIKIIRPYLPRLIGKIEPHIHLFARLNTALLARYIKKHKENYNLCISTKMEADFGKKGIQFLHHEPEGTAKHFYDGLYLWILSKIGRKNEGIKQNITISPSIYIKNLYENIYHAESIVVYPPVYHNRWLNECTWADRVDGFLIIGEINKIKNTHMAIEIIDELIKQGFKIGLTIIGQGKGSYYNKIKKMVDSRKQYITLEGFVSKNGYSWFINSYKYAIHTRINEPSSVALREEILNGCIVFAHNSGGNPEILEYNENLLFKTKIEAVEKIKTILNDESLQYSTINYLKQIVFDTRKEYINKIRRYLK